MREQPARQLSLFDSTSLIVGIIIGVGIYQMAPDIAKAVGGPWGVIGIWLLGGALSLCGALSYAELATAYPRAGGDYVYLSRAYGPWAGFLFGWAQMAVVRPGDIAVMAFAFATYARAIYDPFAGTGFAYSQQVYAIAATIALTAINVLGVREGKWTQNILTSIKAAGLLVIVAAAVVAHTGGTAGSVSSVESATAGGSLPFSLALIFVLFTYGGWNEMAYVAAEVKNPQRNILRALLLGILAVATLYVLVNGAFLHALGFEGLKSSEAVATDTVRAAFPSGAGVFISLLICLSALGAVNGLILTGARISYALGADYPLFGMLGRWNSRTGTPAAALIAQGVITVLLIVLLGSFINAVLYTAATVYSFYFGSTLAVLILRRKEPEVERPYRVWGYPVVPLAFCAVCLLLIHSAVTYKPVVAAGSGVLLLVGMIIYVVIRRR